VSRKVIFLFVLAIVNAGCLQSGSTMETVNTTRISYSYKPEAVNEGVIDWVTFTEPDDLVIERTLKNGTKTQCGTKIISSSVRGNAWSADDILQAIKKDAVQKLLTAGSKVLRLNTVLDNEGKTQPFIFQWMSTTLTILPPLEEDADMPKAGEDVAGLVYVLSKVYKQQLNMPECKSLANG